jgi:peptidoglycan hydrolase CwlO-like protein
MEKIEIKITLSEEEVQEAWSMLRDIQSSLQDINNKLDELQQKED